MTLDASQLTGMYPALPTPFRPDGGVDEPRLERLADRLIGAGASGLVPIGGTGEYTAMSPDARTQAVAATVRAARGRVPVVAGVLSPGYAEALSAGQAFMQAGADGLLLITPFYARPTAATLRAYFRKYAAESGAPLLLYDIGARTGVSVTPEMVADLADDGSIIGMKACNTDLNHFERIVRLTGRRIALLSGDDYLYPAHAQLGAHGGILASSVLLPRYWDQIARLARDGDHAGAQRGRARILPLLDALFAQTNPGPLKAALRLNGMEFGDVVLPLAPPDDIAVRRLQSLMLELASAGVDDLAGMTH
ncbi:dihydrodipicolinate synthase [Bordetella ansorpii]|uniref:Dihydrodipicolinate synthase n=1 Tax=Bordetella ansorpii TaxID=288768 RepID=A0A157RCV0_9BORD|nr:dihydrodipicolinate synthase family protein [Bordetella ansorpii]SAI55706.1 dihydrodipicolinate synthase [Bordetella ansorpii]